MTQLYSLIHSGEKTFEISCEGEARHPALNSLLRAKCCHLQTPVIQTAIHQFAIKQQQSVRCCCPSMRAAREDYSCLPAASGKPTCCTVLLPGVITPPRRHCRKENAVLHSVSNSVASSCPSALGIHSKPAEPFSSMCSKQSCK